MCHDMAGTGDQGPGSDQCHMRDTGHLRGDWCHHTQYSCDHRDHGTWNMKDDKADTDMSSGPGTCPQDMSWYTGQMRDMTCHDMTNTGPCPPRDTHNMFHCIYDIFL